MYVAGAAAFVVAGHAAGAAGGGGGRTSELLRVREEADCMEVVPTRMEVVPTGMANVGASACLALKYVGEADPTDETDASESVLPRWLHISVNPSETSV